MMVGDTTFRGRAAVVDAVRTPFALRGTDYRELDAVRLGALCVSELLSRAPVAADAIDRVVFGRALNHVGESAFGDSNVARQVALRAGLPRHCDAYSVSRGCATSYQSAVEGALAIALGEVECVVAGGTDSASAMPPTLSPELSRALHRVAEAGGWVNQARELRRFHPPDLVPRASEGVDAFTGLSLGQAAEQLAKRYGISREAQDQLAERSHRRAAAALDDGKLDADLMTVYVPPRYEAAVSSDNSLRPELGHEEYAELLPAFDARYGSVTTGNSAPISDGAAALLMMSTAQAQAVGAPVLGLMRAHAFVALDPEDEMLMGAAYAIPLVLQRTGMELADLDLIDLHEGSGVQVLAVTQALESDHFARTKLNRGGRVGEVRWDKVNVSGGSLAFGHPFAATGARQIGQTLRELKRRGGERALCAASSSGGFGAALILEATS